MKNLSLAPFFMFLFASNRNVSEAFSHNNFANERSLAGGWSASQYVKMQPPKSQGASSYDELKQSVNLAQDVLEQFSHAFVLQNLKGEDGQINDKKQQVTFLRTRGTESKIYYNGKRVEEGYMPASITGQFNSFKELAENKDFAPIYVYSSGAKSFERAVEKSLKESGKEVRDIARITVATDNAKTLYDLCDYVCAHHAKKGKDSIFDIDKSNPLILRDWNQKSSGFFSAKLNVPIKTPSGRAYAEIMMVPQLPEKQNILGINRLSHAAYEVVRKNNGSFYSNEELRKWNVVVRDAKANGLVDMENIIGQEVRTKGDVKPVTTRDFDENMMKYLFGSIGPEAPLKRRQDEMDKIRKELNKKAMRDICCDHDWNPDNIEEVSRRYTYPNNMVRFEEVKKFQGCDVTSMGFYR